MNWVTLLLGPDFCWVVKRQATRHSQNSSFADGRLLLAEILGDPLFDEGIVAVQIHESLHLCDVLGLDMPSESHYR